MGQERVGWVSEQEQAVTNMRQETETPAEPEPLTKMSTDLQGHEGKEALQSCLAHIIGPRMTQIQSQLCFFLSL